MTPVAARVRGRVVAIVVAASCLCCGPSETDRPLDTDEDRTSDEWAADIVADSLDECMAYDPVTRIIDDAVTLDDSTRKKRMVRIVVGIPPGKDSVVIEPVSVDDAGRKCDLLEVLGVNLVWVPKPSNLTRLVFRTADRRGMCASLTIKLRRCALLELNALEFSGQEANRVPLSLNDSLPHCCGSLVCCDNGECHLNPDKPAGSSARQSASTDEGNDRK